MFFSGPVARRAIAAIERLRVMRRYVVCLTSATVLLLSISLDRARAEDWARESQDLANSLGAEISHEPTEAATFRELAVRRARAGDLADAKSIADRILYVPSRAAAYGQFALIEARRTHFAEAKRLADRIVYKPYRLAAYREIVAIEARAGDIADAKALAWHTRMASDWQRQKDWTVGPLANLSTSGPIVGPLANLPPTGQIGNLPHVDTSPCGLGGAKVTGVWFCNGQAIYDCPPDWPPQTGPAPIPQPPLPGIVPQSAAALPADYLAPHRVHGPIVSFNDSCDSRGTRVTGRTYADGSVIIETPR